MKDLWEGYLWCVGLTVGLTLMAACLFVHGSGWGLAFAFGAGYAWNAVRDFGKLIRNRPEK